jgi:hypothetical protein
MSDKLVVGFFEASVTIVVGMGTLHYFGWTVGITVVPFRCEPQLVGDHSG